MITEILHDVAIKGIHLYLKDDRLAFKAPRDALTPELQKKISEHKDQIILFLKGQDINGSRAEKKIQKTDRSSKSFSLSFAQQRLWLLDQIDEGSAHYNLASVLVCRGQLNYKAVEQAFTTILERHESLRTCFVAGDGGQPLQIIQAPVPFVVPFTNLSDLEEGERRIQMGKYVADEALQVFDLTCDLMLRAQLIKVDTAEHIVLVTMHHIASDGWSMAILINEFSALYSAYVQGQQNPLPPLEIQYADYAHWQRNWLQGEVLDQQLDYWTKQLADLPVVHSLPLDHPRPPIQSFAGKTHRTQIDAVNSKLLNDLCHSHGATLFMGLHAAFSVLIARHSNETDIVVGSPIANREQTEVANLIGFFVNTLVLRSDLSKNPNFIQLINQSKNMLLDAYAHQQVPFEQIVERLQPERNLSHNALFQVVLVLQNNVQGALSLPGLTLETMAQDSGTARFDLTLNIIERVEGLCLEWEYNTDLFERDTVARMATHFELLLNALLATPQENVFSVEMLSEQERQKLLIDWNNTQTDYPTDKCIHELFETQVKNNPDAIAVIFENQQLTYEQLNQHANQLAHYLVNEKNVKPDTLVGICVERSLEMVIGILAILKAGSAYVPLDPEYPEARLKYMLDDANLATVITKLHLRENTPVTDQQAVCLDDENIQQQLNTQSIQNPHAKQSGLTSNHLAYVIYTSGSTGNPKGSLLQHTNLCNLTLAQIEGFRITPESRVLQFASIAFDAATSELFTALARGAAVVLLTNQTTKSPDAISSMVQKNQITHATLPPVLLPLLNISHWHSVQTLIVAGDACSESLAREWSKNRLFINAYGPSEATVCSTMGIYTEEQSVLHIGKPINNVQIYVLNDQQMLVPQNAVGELYVGGVGLARGYLNRADLTAEKFIPNPFYNKTNLSSSKRLYKTGDLVRWLPDGNLEFLGRIDHQIKIRGFRIELGEIENTLISHINVKDVVVMAKESNTGDKRLVAYVVTDVITAADSAENDSSFILHQNLIQSLRQYLIQSLPDYMVPSAFVLLEQFPLTPNGKVDRKVLPEPDISTQQNTYIAPRTEIEKILCEIWQDILGVERVGITDNFFQLGGHSLLIMQVISRLQQRDFSITARQLLTTPTLSDLAKALETRQLKQPLFTAPANLIPDNCEHITPEMLSLADLQEEDIAHIVAQVPGGVENIQDIYRLAPLQEGILFLHMMNDKVDPYVMTMLFNMTSAKEVADFIEALQFMINRHDVLRTAIYWRELSAPAQVVCRQAKLPVQWLKLDGQDVKAQMLTRCEPGQQWMNLGQAPLVQLQVAIEPDSERHYVLLQLHHIISDHVGLEIIQQEIALYQAGLADTLPATLPYREFVAHAQQQALHHDAENYFKSVLGDLEETTAPFNVIDVNGDGTQVVELRASIPDELSARIRALSKKLKLSPAILFHTAWAMVIAGCSGRDDVVFGTVLSGRLQGMSGADTMLGIFINTLPIRVKLGNRSVIEVVRQVQDSLLNLLPYEQASLALAQRCSGLDNGSPLFTSMLNYRHSVAQSNVSGSNNSGFEVIDGHERTNYPFNVSVDDLGDAFLLEVQIDKAVSADRVLEYLQTAIARLVDELQSTPQKIISCISILPQTECQQLLIDWNSTQTNYPKEKCIHELFEIQVENNPTAIAVVYENQQLTYEQLNQKANQLAHYLVNEKNVKPDTLVGICVGRSLEMIVGILAILKAGGAYVPLDPEYPEARLKYMLDDAKLSTVLTQRHLRETTPVNDAQAVCIDAENFQQQLTIQPTINPNKNDLGLTSHHLAYVIYTSGSTGNPKGVMIQHEGVVNLVEALRDSYRLATADSILQFAPMSFDMSVEEIFGALCNGCKLVLRTESWLESASKFWQYCASAEVTVLNLPAAFWHELARDKNAMPAKSVRHISIGGEKISEIAVKDWFEKNTSFPVLLNAYGPTECTVNASFAEINKDYGNSIGKALNNIQLLVLNSFCALSPMGVGGELHLGGVGLARGYLNRPELTAEKFIANPFYDKTNPSSSERLYKTGDLVRWLPNGNLEFLGRVDHQVKIRGFRIELGEIENILNTYFSVKDAIVTAKESFIADKRLIAYVVTDAIDLQDDSEQAAIVRYELIEQLRHHVSNSLPDYMVPSVIVLLKNFPLTPNGKVDRKALPDVDMSTQNIYCAPHTEMEKILCDIWQEVLGIGRVGITDNFFSLGGHSLLIMQVISRLQQHGLSISARQLFTTPLIADLAKVLDTNRSHISFEFKAPPSLIKNGCKFITPEMLPLISLNGKEIASIVEKIPGGASNVQDIYPLGPLQEGILFHHLLSTQNDPYIMPSLYRVKGAQAVTDFISALQFIINRHDVLRTAIFWHELSTPVQVVLREASLPVTWLKFGAEKNIETEMRALCTPQQQWMDLGKAPLLNLQIANDPNSREYFVVLQYHHIISDHVGLDIIQHELTLYQSGQIERLPQAVPYREFVAHSQYQALHNDADGFFKKMLGDIDEPTVPFNLLDVNGDGGRIVELRAGVPAKISADIRRISRQLSVSPAAFFHAVWAIVVANCSRRDDVVFGTLLSGRLQGTLGAESMLGVFINTLPLRVTLNNVSVIALIHQVQNSLLELLPYEQVSLALAQNRSGIPKGSPLFSALLNYRHSTPVSNQNTQSAYDLETNNSFQHPEFESKFEFIAGQERTNYPFNLSVDDFGEDFAFDLQVDNSISAERVMDYIQTATLELVKALEFTPHQVVNTLSILPESERQQILVEWNNTGADYSDKKCIHEFFEVQVNKNPDAVAVIFEDQQLTYSVLNQKSNQLAHYLINEKHITPDTLVGICVERSLDMVIGILAILKSGGAYVPLDPEYPKARLQYMLSDAKLSIVLTQTHLRESTPVTDEQAIYLDDETLQKLLQAQPVKNPDLHEIGLTPSHLAYVIYTSGSTGNPKGVMIEHQALVNRIEWMDDKYGSSPDDRILQKTPFSFDVSVWEFLWPLSVGASLILAKPEGHKDPLYLSALIRDQQITKLHFVPSMLGSMLALGDLSQCKNLRQVFCSGEALSLHHITEFQTRCPQAELHNLYGPTEAAIDVSYWDCSQWHADLSSVPIGQPINNIQLFVLNSHMGLVPEQVAGELHIGGVGLARGYLNRNDLTNEKFILNPFYDKKKSSSSERLYKTGDLVRWLPDGNLEFLGRIDHQVKIRGFRIELGEIENTLSLHTRVRDAVVLAKESSVTGDKNLVAYIVTDAIAVQDQSEAALADRSDLIENLQHHISEILPNYMVPGAFVFLEKLPLTPNGKLDRKALPEPDVASQRATYVAPRTEIEKILCEICQDILDVERVGMTDNFFQLGGHSLLLMKLLASVENKLGVTMSAKLIFEYKDIQGIAEYLTLMRMSLSQEKSTDYAEEMETFQL